MRLGEGAAPHRVSRVGRPAQSRRAGLRAWPRALVARLRRAGARPLRALSRRLPGPRRPRRFLTETWVRKDAEGKWRPHYDPRIADEYRRTLPDKDIELWYLYDAIRCPTFVLRGAQSDLLSRETADAMARRGPKAKVIEIPGVGHAPTLLNPDQIAIVRSCLIEGEPA